MKVSTAEPYYLEEAPGGGYVKYDAIPIYLASSGSLNVRAHLPAVYIQKIVVDPTKIVAFSGTRTRKGKGKGKGKKGKSGVTPAAVPPKGGKGFSGVIPAVPGAASSSGVVPPLVVDPSRELAEALVVYASWSNDFLLTVYHHSFKDRRVVGYAGEGRNFTTAHPDRKTDWFECPACGAPNTPGSLLCFEPRCLAVYYFEHEDQIFSPIARKVYEIQAEHIKQELDAQADAPDWGGDE